MREACDKAIDVCKKVGKPSQEDRKVLNKLFPSTGSSSSRLSAASSRSFKFNPKKESCAELNKLKKKAAVLKKGKGGKSRTITAVLFKKLPLMVPKGSLRKKLSDEGRIKR